MKIFDVLTEAMVYGPPGSKAMGIGNFGALSKFYSVPAERTSEKLLLSFGNNNAVDLTSQDVDALADYYNKLPSKEAKGQFILGPMAMYGEFLKVARRLNLSVAAPKAPQQGELPFQTRQSDLFEKDQDAEISRGKVRSSELSVLLKRAYARYPQAQSDIEALVMYDLDQQKNTTQSLTQQDKTNQRQDDVMRQLSDLTKRQSQQIAALDQENDDLSDELDRIEAEIPAMAAQVAPAAPGTEKPAAAADREVSKKDREAAKARRQADRKKEKDAQADADQEKKPAAKKKPAKKPTGGVKKLRRTPAQTAADKAAAPAPAPAPAPASAAAADADADEFSGIPDELVKQAEKEAGAVISKAKTPLAVPDDAEGMAQPTAQQKELFQTETKGNDEKIAGRYDPDDFDQMVARLGQRARAQERQHGPIDIGKLAQRLRDIEQKQDQTRGR